MTKYSDSDEYLVICPEKLKLTRLILAFCHLRRLDFRKFCDYPQELGPKPIGDDWRVKRSLILIRILNLIAVPLQIFGDVIEFILNFLDLNGGPIRFTFRFLTGRLKIPKKGSKDYLSFVGQLENRTNLYQWEGKGKMNILPSCPGDQFYIDLCAMASNVAYENQTIIRNRVVDHWKMNFVNFYSCWDDAARAYTTQSFVCTDQAENGNIILVTFRGTEPFNAKDWATDADLSFYKIPYVGRVHLGFLEALGLGNRYEEGIVKNLDMVDQKDKPLAYYTLVSELHKLLKTHRDAKILVTGHSLGGALAILFAAALILKDENEILDKLMGVYTYGQPKVGDEEFGKFMESSKLIKPVPRYYRIVYCYDLVPRLPYGGFWKGYQHFGTCLYYYCFFFLEHNLSHEPFRDFSLGYAIISSVNAVIAGVECFFLPFVKGRDYRETWVCILLRYTAGMVFPGLLFHCLVNYINCARLGPKRLVPA